ncbi:MAG TPA: glycoside hydrolase family 15 protein [Gemmatimonadaceae bacterium]|nr:glycoside hydrolase family 15 protein [Gemmatimonadaceae bacterium]
MHSIGLVAWLTVATNLVTGNGFGFAVVSPGTATVTKFYSHPYSFSRPDPEHPFGEGVETTNFIESLHFPCRAGHDASADYDQDSHVIRVRCSAGHGTVVMPFGLAQAALIVSWEPSAAARQDDLQVEWSRPVQSRRSVRTRGGSFEVLTFDGIRESLVLIPLAPGRSALALISVDSGGDPGQVADAFNRWRGGRAPQALAAREIAALERWRVAAPPTISARELHLWRQSEVMLRMAQSREPNRPGRYGNGMIVASLPDGVWFTPWVRDMAWSAMALTRMGHRVEARAALLAYFNARPTGKMRAEVKGADYQVSVVRYFGDGSEEPFFTMEGSPNIEFDDWGEVLWLLGEYTQTYHDTALLSEHTSCGTLYQCARDLVLRPLVTNLEPYDGGLIVDEDTSIWEEHQKDKKHFAFSTGMAIVGLNSFASVAQAAGDDVTRREILDTVALLQTGFTAAFIRGGTLHGTLEEGVKNDIDGALMAIIHLGVVTDSAIVRSTVERMPLLEVASGGYRRVRSTYTDPAIFEYWYERQEFLFVDFSLAEIDRQLGRNAESAALVHRIVDNAVADHNIIPEMYVAVPCTLFPGKIGDPTGARPMVGYGAGAYILDVLDRATIDRTH